MINIDLRVLLAVSSLLENSYYCVCGKHSANSIFDIVPPVEFIKAERYSGAPD